MIYSTESVLFNRSLSDLRQKHRSLDDKLERLRKKRLTNDIEITRIKREKLKLKDIIGRLESEMRPNIIA